MPHALDPQYERLPQMLKDPFSEVRPIEIEKDADAPANRLQLWKPISLRTPFIVSTIVISLGLAVLLQVLLVRSQNNEGLLFASRIVNLSLWSRFLYLYLPTTIAVVYSLAWSWIDQDTKRIEPWRQLSKAEGATAHDSLLLHYASDFLAVVPVKALRRRHWPVFIASTALVLTSWALTPLQAAIFATHAVTKAYNEPMLVSTKYLSTSEQQSKVTVNYTYSVFNIAWLNESLPPYMSRQVALAPFQPQTLSSQIRDLETWTAATTLFSVDVGCQPAILESGCPSTELCYTSLYGCKVPYPYGPDGNQTIGGSGIWQVKEYTAFYAAYQNGGLADYYISPYCPANASDVFLAAFAQNKRHAADTPKNATTLFCKPTYYRQNASATVRRQDRQIVNITTTGNKLPVPATMFNPGRLEGQMNSAIQQRTVRGEIPSSRWPDQREQLSKLPLSIYDGDQVPMMAGMAIGADNRPLQDYLDPHTLAQSYEAAYRLLFARAMIDVLQADFSTASTANGTRCYHVEAVYMVPGITYAVEAILCVSVLLALTLWAIGLRSRVLLRDDPGSIATLMTMTSNDESLLECFSRFEGMHDRDCKQLLDGERYRVDHNNSTYTLRRLGDLSHPGPAATLIVPASEDKPIYRPWEFSLLVGGVLLVIQFGLLATLSYLYNTGESAGIPLPSSNRFVRQMLENYVPTIIATLIEPVWVMLNRLLCALQPFEELRKGAATARRSIELNYVSMPPQLAIVKAIVERRFLLGAVCFMALLANLLAVAFGAMFNEATVSVAIAMNFTQVYQPLFKAIDGKAGPYGTTPKDGAGLDQVYITMSNLTTGTSMPVWTDDNSFYLPFAPAVTTDETRKYRATTRAFRASLQCRHLQQGSPDSWSLTIGSQSQTTWPATANLSVHISDSQFGVSSCVAENLAIVTQLDDDQCPQGDTAMEIVTTMWAPGNSSLAEHDACRKLVVSGWFRSPAGDACMRGSENGTSSQWNVSVTDDGATVIACMPGLATQSVHVTVSPEGIVDSVDVLSPPDTDIPKYFTGDPEQLILQANNFLINNGEEYGVSPGGTWHNDSFSSNWNNYIMELIAGNDNTLNPRSRPPSSVEAVALFSAMYSKLFAIWLGIHHTEFLEQTAHTPIETVGEMLQEETRITISKPMFWIAIAILATYALVILAVYARRPDRFLPYLPTTIASIIALFAASRTVRSFIEYAHLSERERNMRLAECDLRFGYGTFVGTDHNIHTGIEQELFITREQARISGCASRTGLSAFSKSLRPSKGQRH